MNTPRPLSIRSLVATAAVALAASTALAFSRPATLVIDGQRVESDVPPVTQNHEAYVPLRAVTTGIGAEMTYDKATRTIDVTRGADRLKLRLGERTALLNGRTVSLKHAPFAVRGRTMVAARTIERALGPKVRYDQRKATIDVFTTDTSVAADGGDPASSNAF
ncbi:MAG: copper amine oxidase N-terminal domain-containing protein [Candidatus Eremiobacteraeota bacterium]|nr:copper amine oxidase N-terminal domain-containing protein [Candidatus Eremiobacteraeota bacterium]